MYELGCESMRLGGETLALSGKIHFMQKIIVPDGCLKRGKATSFGNIGGIESFPTVIPIFLDSYSSS